jgi:hypothetical protein
MIEVLNGTPGPGDTGVGADGRSQPLVVSRVTRPRRPGAPQGKKPRNATSACRRTRAPVLARLLNRIRFISHIPESTMRPFAKSAATLVGALALPLAMSTAFAGPPAPAADESIGPAQLEIAPHVLTGRADCEFGQHVDVTPVEGRPGLFKVSHGKSKYLMVPQETSTGAVRLEDRKAGVMWLQIPAKSMLMDSRAGRRVVDLCQTARQRDTPAGVGIGIVTAVTH